MNVFMYILWFSRTWIRVDAVYHRWLTLQGGQQEMMIGTQMLPAIFIFNERHKMLTPSHSYFVDLTHKRRQRQQFPKGAGHRQATA